MSVLTELEEKFDAYVTELRRVEDPQQIDWTDNEATRVFNGIVEGLQTLASLITTTAEDKLNTISSLSSQIVEIVLQATDQNLSLNKKLQVLNQAEQASVAVRPYYANMVRNRKVNE